MGSYTIRIATSAEYGAYVYKLSNAYGTVTIWGYISSEHYPMMLKLHNNVWYDYTYLLSSDLSADFTSAVVQDLNSPTMAINSYLNDVSNPPNGYQTGGKVISVIDSNRELGAQLSLTRGYAHPQYRYKDNNGWSGWKNILISSDLETIQVGSDRTITDCNDILPGVMAYTYSTAAHCPSSSTNRSWNVWCIGLLNYRAQIAISVTDSSSILMIRASLAGVWSEWVEK